VPVTTVAIPAWTSTGVLPPFDASFEAVSASRSPYHVSLADVVLRFGSTSDRQRILDGLLRYRAALHAVGLTMGFQWLNGSFMENIESLEGRSPNDVDVVTFFQLPSGMTQESVAAAAPTIFPMTQPQRVVFKEHYFVDPYPVDLASPPGRLVRLSAYWYSVWSHRRDSSWKGYLQIDLSPAKDAAASALLRVAAVSGATP
jgi:hypothetical protein